MALVLGLRLLNGSLGLNVALAVLLLTPEVYLPLRRAAAQFHSSSDGIAAAAAIYSAVGSRILYITGSREPAVQARIASVHPAPVLFKPIRFDQLKKAVFQALGNLPSTPPGAAGI